MMPGGRKSKYYSYIDGCYVKKGRSCTLNNKNLDRLLDYARTSTENLPFIFILLSGRSKRYAERNNLPYLQVTCQIYKRLFFNCFLFLATSWFTLLLDVSFLLFESPYFLVRCMGLDLLATFYVIPIDVLYLSTIIHQGKRLTASSLQYVALPLDRSDAVSAFLRDNQDLLLRGMSNLSTFLTRFNPRYPLLELIALHFSATRCFLWLYFTYCTLFLDTDEAQRNYRNLAGALIIAYTLSCNIKFLDSLSVALQPSIDLGRVLLQKNVEVLLDYYNLYQIILNNALSNKQIMLRGPMATQPGLPSSFFTTDKSTPWHDLIAVLDSSANMYLKPTTVTDEHLLLKKEYAAMDIVPDQGILCYWRLLIKSFSLVLGEQTEDARGTILLTDGSAGTLLVIEELVPVLDHNASRVLDSFSETRTKILFRLIHTLYGSNRMLTHVPSIFHWIQHHMLTSRLVSAMMLRLLVIELSKFRQMCVLIGTSMQISSAYLHGIATTLLTDCPYALFTLILATILSRYFDSRLKMDVIRKLLNHCAEQDTLAPDFLSNFLVSTNVEKTVNDAVLIQMRTDVSSVAIELLTSLPQLNSDLSRIFLKRTYTLLYHLRLFFHMEVSSLPQATCEAYDIFFSQLHDLLFQHTIVIVFTGIHNSREHFNASEKPAEVVPHISPTTTSKQVKIPALPLKHIAETSKETCLFNTSYNQSKKSTTDDIDSLSLISLQSSRVRSIKYNLENYIFGYIKNSQFWGVLTKVASSHLHDGFLTIRCPLDQLILDFIASSCLKKFLISLQEPVNSTSAQARKQTPYSNHVHQRHDERSFDSTFTASVFQPDGLLNAFEQAFSLDQESSAGIPSTILPSTETHHATNEFSDLVTEPASTLSVGPSESTNLAVYTTIHATDYLGTTPLISMPCAPVPMTKIAPQHALTPLTQSQSAEHEAHSSQKVSMMLDTVTPAPNPNNPVMSNQTVVATILSETTLMRTLLSHAQSQPIFYLMLIYSDLIGDTLRLDENKGGFLFLDSWQIFSNLMISMLTGAALSLSSLDSISTSLVLPIFYLHEFLSGQSRLKETTSDLEAPTWSNSLNREVESVESSTKKPYSFSLFEYLTDELTKAPSYDILPHIIHTIYPDVTVPMPLGYVFALILISAPNPDEANLNSNKYPHGKQSDLPSCTTSLCSFPVLDNPDTPSERVLTEKKRMSDSGLDDACLLDYARPNTQKKHVRRLQSSTFFQSICTSYFKFGGSVSTILGTDSLFRGTAGTWTRGKGYTRIKPGHFIVQDKSHINDSQYISRSFFRSRKHHIPLSSTTKDQHSVADHSSITKPLSIAQLQEGIAIVTRRYTLLATTVIRGKHGSVKLIDELYVKIPLSVIALWTLHNKAISIVCLLSCFVIPFIYVFSKDARDDSQLFLMYQKPPIVSQRSHRSTAQSTRLSMKGFSPSSDVKSRPTRWNDMLEAPEIKAFITELCKRYEVLHPFFQTNVSRLLSVLLEAFYKHLELAKKLDRCIIDCLAVLNARVSKCCKFFDCPEREHIEKLILSMPSAAGYNELRALAEELSKLPAASALSYLEAIDESTDYLTFSKEIKIIQNKLNMTSPARNENTMTVSSLYFQHFMLPCMVIKRLLTNQFSYISSLITQPSIEFLNSMSTTLHWNIKQYATANQTLITSEVLQLVPRHPSTDPLYILSLITGVEFTLQISTELYEYGNLCISEAQHTRPISKTPLNVTTGNTALTSMVMEVSNRANMHENYAFILNFDR